MCRKKLILKDIPKELSSDGVLGVQWLTRCTVGEEKPADGWRVTSQLCLTEIRNGNLKAILGLFFSLSRYKQQQQQPHHHPSQQAAPPSQCQAGVPQQQVPAPLQTPCQQPPQAVQHQFKAQPEMQSRWENLLKLGFFSLFISFFFASRWRPWKAKETPFLSSALE